MERFSMAPINTYYTHLLASPIVERLRVLRRLRQGGFSRAAPRNQSRRGFLKPLILLSFLFFEMEETVLIGYLILKHCLYRNRSDDDKRRKPSPLERNNTISNLEEQRELKLQDMWTCPLHSFILFYF
ncbi:hypothetical protein Bca4012_031677 [Brassica carinata]